MPSIFADTETAFWSACFVIVFFIFVLFHNLFGFSISKTETANALLYDVANSPSLFSVVSILGLLFLTQ